MKRLCVSCQGFVRPCHQVSSLTQVFVEPLSADDWEILVGDVQNSSVNMFLISQNVDLCTQECSVFPFTVFVTNAVF